MLLALIVIGLVPLILRHEYIGIYVWSWLSYMIPQRLAFGFALSIPWAQIIAITLFVSLLLSREGKALSKDKTVVVWIMYLLWMTLTTLFALQPQAAWEGFSTVMKIQFVTFLTLVSLLVSQSRGALVAIVAVGGFFWLKSRNKMFSASAIVLFALIGFSLMSETWLDRMETIRNYEQDASAMSGLNFSAYNLNLASDRLFGGGFGSESTETFLVYAPNPDDVHSAHSIFFGVPGEHGWLGLTLFLAILWLTWLSLSYVIRRTKDSENESELGKNLLARILQVSLIAYCSGRAFLSLAYFDLPRHIIAISILLKNQFHAATGRETGMLERKDAVEQGPFAAGSRAGLRSEHR